MQDSSPKMTDETNRTDEAALLFASLADNLNDSIKGFCEILLESFVPTIFKTYKQMVAIIGTREIDKVDFLAEWRKCRRKEKSLEMYRRRYSRHSKNRK